MKNKILTIVWIIVFIGVLVLLNIFMEKQSQNYITENNIVSSNTLTNNTENVLTVNNDNDNENENTSKIINVTSENFKEEVINSDKTVLIDFYATWCEPCKIMSPIIDMIANENNNIKVVKIDVDISPEIAAEYGAYSIPTFVVIKDGEEVSRTVGITKKVELLKMINN